MSSVDTQTVKTMWEEELEATDIDDETWDNIWSYMFYIRKLDKLEPHLHPIMHREGWEFSVIIKIQ